MDHDYAWESIDYLIHAHLEDILRHFESKWHGEVLIASLCVLKAVKYDDGVSTWMLQNPSLASSLEKTVVPFNQWETSSRVGAL